MKCLYIMNKQVQHKNIIIFSFVIAIFLLLVTSARYLQNMVFAAAKVNTTNMTLIDKDKTEIILDPQSGKTVKSEAGKMATQNESGSMMGSMMINMMNETTNQSSMLERGNIAMGFNQNKIMHHFIATPTGGEIMIVVLNSTDNNTIKQIKSHVLDIQKEFSQGNFTKPFYIHAQQVPGTKLMSQKKDLIRYSTRQINNGSVLLLTTNDQQLIAAIHQFIAFQTAQHMGH
jgi:hypothetical protein